MKSKTPHDKDVLAYSEYRTIKALEYIEDGHGPPTLDTDYTGSNRQAYEWNSKHYLGATGICPFCKLRMLIPLENPSRLGHNTVWECPKCGWWELERVFLSGGVEHEVAFSAVHYQACVKRFDISSAVTPTDALVDHLRKRPNAFYGIHKKKMEEVVQYVFSDFYDCEVHHCGKSHDGGIDLVMINADEPTMIQVKCRESSTAVEPISQIREFLGAMWIKKSTRGIFVSTADHYSAVSVRTIRRMLSEGTITFFDMVNFGKLTGLLESTTSPRERIWHKLLTDNYIYGETG